MRIDRLKLPDFRNLKNFEINFDESQPTTVILGRNGSGKSNLIEALVEIFRDLEDGTASAFAYEISYLCHGRRVEVINDPNEKKREQYSVDGVGVIGVEGLLKSELYGLRSYAECLESMSDSLKVLLASLEDYIISLGDDVQKKELKLYAAYKRLKNFTSVVIQKNRLVLYLNLKPAQLGPLPAIARDVTQSGHWGTGDLELVISSSDDLDLAKSFIRMAYEGRGGR